MVSQFARFMREPEQLAELAKAGFRTEVGSLLDHHHQLRAAVGPVVRGRHRDARDVGRTR